LSEIRSLVDESDLQVEFFANGDVQSLCKTMRVLLNSPAIRRAQARHNFECIQRTRPEKTCRAYIKAFNRALEKRHSLKQIMVPGVNSESA